METDLSITISLRMIRPAPSLGMRPDSLPVHRSVQGRQGPTVILHPVPIPIPTPGLGAGTASSTSNYNPGTQDRQGPIVELHPRPELEPTGLNTRSQTDLWLSSAWGISNVDLYLYSYPNFDSYKSLCWVVCLLTFYLNILMRYLSEIVKLWNWYCNPLKWFLNILVFILILFLLLFSQNKHCQKKILINLNICLLSNTSNK